VKGTIAKFPAYRQAGKHQAPNNDQNSNEQTQNIKFDEAVLVNWILVI
jgi:hypothetical protein